MGYYLARCAEKAKQQKQAAHAARLHSSGVPANGNEPSGGESIARLEERSHEQNPQQHVHGGERQVRFLYP